MHAVVAKNDWGWISITTTPGAACSTCSASGTTAPPRRPWPPRRGRDLAAGRAWGTGGARDTARLGLWPFGGLGDGSGLWKL